MQPFGQHQKEVLNVMVKCTKCELTFQVPHAPQTTFRTLPLSYPIISEHRKGKAEMFKIWYRFQSKNNSPLNSRLT